MTGPLEPLALTGLTVIDATQMLAGPIATMRLGDLGADVIKIEPIAGEYSRSHGFVDKNIGTESTTFVALNRNKRSVSLDLKRPEGISALYDLIAEADVFIQNYRVGVADRLGVDWPTLSAINPRLVYCSISGYGQTGPGAGRPGQDLIVQGYSGSMYSVGTADDPPIPGALWTADAMTGYSAVIGILSALWSRQTTDRGQHIDVNMLATVLDAQIQELVTYLNRGTVRERSAESTAHAWIPAPYGVHRTSDGWLTIAMAPLDILAEALDSDELRDMTDPRDGQDRADEVYRIVRAILLTRTTAAWLEHLNAFNVWSGEIYDYAALEADDHVRATDMITTYVHPEHGPIRTPNIPLKLSATPGRIRRHAPMLGEHTAEVLAEVAGYSQAKIDKLSEIGAIKVHADGGQL